jgi:PAS domain S-box-containing protein
LQQNDDMILLWDVFQKHLIEVAETPPFQDSLFNYYERMANYGLESFSEFVPAQKRFRVLKPEFKTSLNYVINTAPKLYEVNQNFLEIIIQDLSEAQSRLTFISFLFIIIISMGLITGYFFIITSTINPLKQVTKAAELISSGELTKNLREGSEDEVGLLIRSINGLIQSLQNISNFASNVGKGNFEVDFQVRSANDELGYALLEMRDNLKKNAIEEEKRRWTTEGFNKFSQILRMNADEAEKLAYNVIANLVNYLNANQGGIFTIEGEGNTRYLDLRAAYAYNRKKYIQKQIPLTSGLLGQSILEQKTIYLTEIPDGYTEITSGLGEATPNSLVICPLKVNDNIYGAIEIASFKNFESYEIEFIEKLSESIATTFATLKSVQNTKILLENTQIYAEQLKLQEEEMRQNVEELAATQEDMKRVQMDLKAKESNLDAIINNTKEVIISLSRNQKVILFNQASISFFEKEGKKIRQGIKFQDIIPERETDFFKRYIARSLKGEYVTITHRTFTKTDEEVYYEIDFIPVRNHENDIEGVSIFIRDITHLNPIRWQVEVTY